MMFRFSSIISVNYSLSSSKKLVYGWWGRRCIVPALVSPTNFCPGRDDVCGRDQMAIKRRTNNKLHEHWWIFKNFRPDVLINPIQIKSHVFSSEFQKLQTVQDILILSFNIALTLISKRRQKMFIFGSLFELKIFDSKFRALLRTRLVSL